MSGMFTKMAPTATVAVLAAWCCWPHLGGLRPATEFQQPDDLPRITDSLLTPTVKPAPERNPFQPLLAKGVDPPEGEEPEAAPPDQQQPPAEEETTDVFSGLVLDAIYIRGNRRVALINGRVYEPGEPLAISAAATEPCVVAEISADKVRLIHRGQTVELKYAGLTFDADPAEAVEQRHEEHR